MERRNIAAPGMSKPRGYEDAIECAGAQRVLFLGGHVAFDANRTILHRGDLVAQMRVTLANLKATLHAADFAVTDLVKLTIHVLDVEAYRARLPEIGQVWKDAFGRFFPAMTLLCVSALMERDSLVEIDGFAAR